MVFLLFLNNFLAFLQYLNVLLFHALPLLDKDFSLRILDSYLLAFSNSLNLYIGINFLDKSVGNSFILFLD